MSERKTIIEAGKDLGQAWRRFLEVVEREVRLDCDRLWRRLKRAAIERAAGI